MAGTSAVGPPRVLAAAAVVFAIALVAAGLFALRADLASTCDAAVAQALNDWQETVPADVTGPPGAPHEHHGG